MTALPFETAGPDADLPPAASGPVLPQVLRVPDVAAAFGLSRSTVYALVKAHEIPHHTVGARLLFDAGELAAWWAGRAVPVRPPTVTQRLAAVPVERPRRGERRGMPQKYEQRRVSGTG